ncbi:MAG: PadR family transcriptional regulator [Anaerolineae bacterium]|nr:PadR family transcriptional regulator [Anaerolineae bacterium]
MSIKYAILGYLSWMPLTGYDLKKLFEESAAFHWSGNNNQIYKTLVELHDEGLVTLEVRQQEDAPPRKIYTITEAGRDALRRGVMTGPELPQLKHALFVQLAWADLLTDDELDGLLMLYQEEVEVQARMYHERKSRKKGVPGRTPRETVLWDAIMDNWITFYENEVTWVRDLRQKLNAMDKKGDSKS